MANENILASWVDDLSIDSLPSVSRKNIYIPFNELYNGFEYIHIPYVQEVVAGSTLNPSPYASNNLFRRKLFPVL